MREKLFLILLCCCIVGKAQESTFQTSFGLRDEIPIIKVNKGNITPIREARLVLDGTLDIKLKNNWSIPVGISIQRYGNRTLIEETVDFGSQLNWQTLPLIHFGLRKTILSLKRVNFLLGISQQLLFIPGENKTIDYNYVLSDDFENFPGKSERVDKLRTLNLITQLSVRAELKVKKKRKLFVSYAYNHGWQSILERTVSYRVGDLNANSMKLGNGVVFTNGSGQQINFGIMFPLR